TASLRTPGFNQLYLSRANLISTLPVEAGSKRLSRPRWHSDPQAAPCRTRARKRVPRLPRRSAARCNLINAVSRLRLPEQSGSSSQTCLARGAGVFYETGWRRRAHCSIRVHSPVILKNPSSFLKINADGRVRDVRFWHKADITAVLIHVRFWGFSGH